MQSIPEDWIMEWPSIQAPRGIYVFLVYTIDHDLIGAFGTRDDADSAAKAYLEDQDGAECKRNFDQEDFWSWYNQNGEVTIKMTKLQ